MLDYRNELIGYLGDGGAIWEEPGWPNGLDDRGVRAPRDLRVGEFRSPHGLATTAEGTIIVAEWLIGGRLVELAPIVE